MNKEIILTEIEIIEGGMGKEINPIPAPIDKPVCGDNKRMQSDFGNSDYTIQMNEREEAESKLRTLDIAVDSQIFILDNHPECCETIKGDGVKTIKIKYGTRWIAYVENDRFIIVKKAVC